MFKNSVLTAMKTSYFMITKIIWLMLYKEIIAVCSKNKTKPHLTVEESGTNVTIDICSSLLYKSTIQRSGVFSWRWMQVQKINVCFIILKCWVNIVLIIIGLWDVYHYFGAVVDVFGKASNSREDCPLIMLTARQTSSTGPAVSCKKETERSL